MKQHPRLRKAAKWGGLGLAGVSAALMAVSAVWSVGFTVPTGHGVLFFSGSARLSWNSPSVFWLPGWFTVNATGPAHPFDTVLTKGVPTTVLRGPGFWWWQVTLDVPAALGLGVGVPAWRLDRRARRRVLAGHCSKCDYDRSTLPAATPCPECGAAGR